MRFFLSRAEVEADRLRSRAETLRSRQVPDAFIEDLATRQESWLGFANGVVFLPVLLIAIYGWWRLLQFALVLPWLRLTRTDVLLGLSGPVYFVGVLGSLFAVIAIVGWLYCFAFRRPGPHPAASTAASLLRESASGSGAALTDWMYRSSARAAGDAATPEDFLLAFGLLQRRFWARVALFLSAAVATAMVWGANDYWLAGTTGLTRHRPFASLTLAWPDATGVTLGCEPGKGGSDLLVYDIGIGGETIDLGTSASPDQAIPIPRRVKVLADIDDELRHAATPRRFKTAPDPTCIARWSQLAGRDGPARVARLLQAH